MVSRLLILLAIAVWTADGAACSVSPNITTTWTKSSVGQVPGAVSQDCTVVSRFSVSNPSATWAMYVDNNGNLYTEDTRGLIMISEGVLSVFLPPSLGRPNAAGDPAIVYCDTVGPLGCYQLFVTPTSDPAVFSSTVVMYSWTGKSQTPQFNVTIDPTMIFCGITFSTPNCTIWALSADYLGIVDNYYQTATIFNASTGAYIVTIPLGPTAYADKYIISISPPETVPVSLYVLGTVTFYSFELLTGAKQWSVTIGSPGTLDVWDAQIAMTPMYAFAFYQSQSITNTLALNPSGGLVSWTDPIFSNPTAVLTNCSLLGSFVGDASPGLGLISPMDSSTLNILPGGFTNVCFVDGNNVAVVYNQTFDGTSSTSFVTLGAVNLDTSSVLWTVNFNNVTGTTGFGCTMVNNDIAAISYTYVSGAGGGNYQGSLYLIGDDGAVSCPTGGLPT